MKDIVPFSQQLAQDFILADETFPVTFDAAWQWLGYSRKADAKRALLSCGFIENVDFSISAEPATTGIQAHPKENIALTVDCFKQWGMMAGTPEAIQIRLYFLNCEKSLKQFVQAPIIAYNPILRNAPEIVAEMREVAAALAALPPCVAEVYAGELLRHFDSTVEFKNQGAQIALNTLDWITVRDWWRANVGTILPTSAKPMSRPLAKRFRDTYPSDRQPINNQSSGVRSYVFPETWVKEAFENQFKNKKFAIAYYS